MRNRSWLRVAAIGVMVVAANVALAQSRTGMLKPPSPGVTEFPACCESCTSSGCTGCNSGPQGLSCGSGLVLAECSMSDNKVSCEEAKSAVRGGPMQLQTR